LSTVPTFNKWPKYNNKYLKLEPILYLFYICVKPFDWETEPILYLFYICVKPFDWETTRLNFKLGTFMKIYKKNDPINNLQ